MKYLLIILFLLITLSLSAIETSDLAHTMACGGIYLISYDFLNTTSLSMDKIEGISFWLALGTGVGKEFYDVSQGGIFDEKDICYDLGGILTSIAFKRYIRHREYKQMMIMLRHNKIGLEYKW